MNLLFGSLALCLAAVLYGLTLIMARNPQSPGWTQGYVPVSMFVMVIISLGSIGVIVSSRAFAAGALPGAQEWVLSLTAASATSVALWSMRIKKRLTRYANQKRDARADAVVIRLEAPPGGPSVPGKSGGGRMAA